MGGWTAAGVAAWAAGCTPQAKCSGEALHPPVEGSRPPNVVIIFTDDQGYQDVGCYGSPLIRTPHLDRMAAEGVRFTDFYVGASVCSPSRAALMTGCYPQRISMNVFEREVNGVLQGGGVVLFQNSPRGLHPDELTLAESLKGQGYATACVGKWHLGHLPEYLPMKAGFDSYFGIPYSNDMPIRRDGKNGAVLLRNGEVEEHPADQATLTRRYAQEAVKFIRANRERPFFLYLAQSMPHIPIFASEAFAGKSPRGLYGDVIEEIDWSVGEVLAAIKETGVDERTLVIFTSDNGPWLSFNERGGSALPLRDGKGTIYEGGMREPCIMRWPGRIPASTVCTELATTMDLMPTIARLAGTHEPMDRIIDGRNILPLMLGTPGAKSPREAFFYYQKHETSPMGVRWGKWKLLKEGPRFHGERDAAGKWRERKSPMPLELYDLEADIGETANVADANPDVVRKMLAMLDAFDAEVKAHTRPAGPAGDLKSSPASAL
jgi:arylsulfatase A-like enzyme